MGDSAPILGNLCREDDKPAGFGWFRGTQLALTSSLQAIGLQSPVLGVGENWAANRIKADLRMPGPANGQSRSPGELMSQLVKAQTQKNYSGLGTQL
eukprot:s1657_g6.t1